MNVLIISCLLFIVLSCNLNKELLDNLNNGLALSSGCLNGTAMLGLRSNMTIVSGTPTTCYDRQECIDKLCKINDHPGVAWVIFRVS